MDAGAFKTKALEAIDSHVQTYFKQLRSYQADGSNATSPSAEALKIRIAEAQSLRILIQRIPESAS